MQPLCIDLFCGLSGWGEAFALEGYRVVGFDIADMCAAFGRTRPEGIQLVIQDVLTIHGSQFRDAAVIVASPPCQEPSKRAMPFKIGKAKTPQQLDFPVPEWWKKSERPKRFKSADEATAADASGKIMSPAEMAEWTAWKIKYPADPPELFLRLFDACFRIQREAIEANERCLCGCHKSKHDDPKGCWECNCVGFIPAHIPLIIENVRGAQPWVGRAAWSFGSFYLWGDVPALMPITLKRGRKVPWFANPATGANSDGVKQLHSRGDGEKTTGHVNQRDGYSHTRHLTNQAESDAVKQAMGRGDWFSKEARAGGASARFGSKSKSRKQASAMIAKIPLALSQHIAATYFPRSLRKDGAQPAAAGKA